MKKLIALATLLFTLCTGSLLAQGIAVRSNLAADAFGIVNGGVDFTLTDQTTVCISVLGGMTYLPDVMLRRTTVIGGQIEYRHWFSHQPYEDFFCGITTMPVIYRMTRKDTEFNGFAVPTGFNFGYSLPINRNLNVEASIGAGIILYTEYGGDGDGRGNLLGKSLEKNYNLDFSTTNISVGVTYILK